MRRLKYILVICLVCIIFIFTAILLKKNFKNNQEKIVKEKEENKSSEKVTKKITFNEKEKKVIDTIYSKLNLDDYFDKENLKSFEIIKLKHIGYYESESNFHYFIVEYTSECKDGTNDCDHLSIYKKNDIELGLPFHFWIKIDMDTYNFIEKIDGISIPFVSDWVSTDSKIE